MPALGPAFRTAFVPLVSWFGTAFMPLVPRFGADFRTRFVTLFRRCFHRLFTIATIAGCLVVCAAISKAVSSASSSPTASTPLARAFALLLLRSAIFFSLAFGGFRFGVILFIAHDDRRHNFL